MTDLDRLKGELGALLAALLRRVDYSALYEARVLTQHEDGSLDVNPLSSRLAPLSNVRIRYGVPVVRVKIRTGGSAVIGFHGADPARPYALIVDGGSIESIALFGGTKPIARMGDSLQGFLPQSLFSGTMTTPGGPAPLIGPIVITQAVPGIITSGNKRALA